MQMRERAFVRRGPGVCRADVPMHSFVVSGRLLPGQSMRHDAVAVDVRHGRSSVRRLWRDGLQRRRLRDVDLQCDDVPERLLHRGHVRDGAVEPVVRSLRRGVRIVRRGPMRWWLVHWELRRHQLPDRVLPGWYLHERHERVGLWHWRGGVLHLLDDVRQSSVHRPVRAGQLRGLLPLGRLPGGHERHGLRRGRSKLRVV